MTFSFVNHFATVARRTRRWTALAGCAALLSFSGHSLAQEGPAVNFRSIVPAPNSGASAAELGAATGQGLNPQCVKPGREWTVVLHAPDSYDATTGIYAISATVGLLPRSTGPLLWPEDAYAVTRAAQGLNPDQRKQMALDTVRQASSALCRILVNPPQAPR
ncbi:MAG: hypothetical protein JSR41_00010 [Proteobacteria bacterium]|nr:hypothetical protein [Pseudomonadota bacterium]